MLEIRWEWVALALLLLVLLGYVAYQRYCWMCDGDDDKGEEAKDGR
jgi:hypothetical protein